MNIIATLLSFSALLSILLIIYFFNKSKQNKNILKLREELRTLLADKAYCILQAKRASDDGEKEMCDWYIEEAGKLNEEIERKREEIRNSK